MKLRKRWTALFGAAVTALVAPTVGCGGASSGGSGAAHAGDTIRAASGAEVTEEAQNHWRDAIRMFEAHDGASEEGAGWTATNCSATGAKFQEANEAQGGRFTEAIYMMAVVQGRCGDDDRALELYRQALSANENYCGARVGVGLADMRQGRTRDAQQHFERAIAADNRCTAAYVNLAIIQRERSGQAREALNNLRRALAIESDYLPAFNQMALLYLDQAEDRRRMLDLAEVVCRQAQLIDGNYAPIYNTWGLINVKQGNIIAALAKFERAFSLDSDLFEAYMNFGQLTLSYRGYEDARRAFTRAGQLRPRSYDAIIGLGAALRGLNQSSEAEAAYRRAIALDGSRPEAYFNLGLLYQDYMGGQEAQLSQATQFYRQFVQRAGERGPFAEAVRGVTRQCRRRAQRRRRRSNRRRAQRQWAGNCRPGRLQQIEVALNLMREMRQMQADIEAQQAASQKSSESSE